MTSKWPLWYPLLSNAWGSTTSMSMPINTTSRRVPQWGCIGLHTASRGSPCRCLRSCRRCIQFWHHHLGFFAFLSNSHCKSLSLSCISPGTAMHDDTSPPRCSWSWYTACWFPSCSKLNSIAFRFICADICPPNVKRPRPLLPTWIRLPFLSLWLRFSQVPHHAARC